MAKRTCSIGGCEEPAHARGWCYRHYDRWRVHGDAGVVLVERDLPPSEKFWLRVNKNGPDGVHSQTNQNLGPCWLWTAAQNDDGYGHIRAGERDVSTHRFAYELLVGPVPRGLELDHLCSVRHCVRPEHLEPVSQKVNVLRSQAPSAINARKTHCIYGHEFDSTNTYVLPSGPRAGKRVCRACARRRQAEAIRRGRSHLAISSA